MTALSTSARRGAAALATAALLLSGCAPARTDAGLVAAGTPNTPITVGADTSPGSRVLAALYRQLLTEAGKPVRDRATAYATPAEAAQAVLRKEITLTPMSETTLLRAFPGSQQIPGNTAANLSMALPVGTTALPPATAERGLVVAAGRATADREGWRSLADPARAGRRLTLGGPAARDPDAPPIAELAKAYGLTLTAAGPSDPVDLLLIRATDPAFARDALVALADPRQALPPEHVFPLLDAGFADEAVRTALARLNTALTTDALAALAQSVTAGQDPAQTAAAWLRSVKLAP